MFNRINVMDFGVMNVGGEDMLSMLYAVEGNGYILDHSYQVKQTVFTGTTGSTFNMHDFRTIEGGTKYLYLQRDMTPASRELSMEELGYDGECKVTFPAFEERDVESLEKLHHWDATGIICMNESTMQFAPVEARCTQNWDYLHSNAIDKFTDGNYLLSTRHSDTIYKISKDDGSIIWRLFGHGGERSDFNMGNLNFSRQHHARIHEQNETHTILTLLDNAKGADQQPPTSAWTRALTVALREDLNPMTAEIIASYDHPAHEHAFRRGSFQVLPNGNAFVGWSEHALQSEHTPDGRLLMEAELETRKLGTYRAFKYSWLSTPDYPPDVHSQAITRNGITTTTVHVSWNGATEVAAWGLYKSDENGKRSVQLVTESRTGFETKLSHGGFARYVHVAAIDRHGALLGMSNVYSTLTDDSVSQAAIDAELVWLQAGEPLEESGAFAMLSNSSYAFIGGIACGVFVFFAVFIAKHRGLLKRYSRSGKGIKYQPVAEMDTWDWDETKLDDLPNSVMQNHRNDVELSDLVEDDSDGKGRERTPSSGQSSAG